MQHFIDASQINTLKIRVIGGINSGLYCILNTSVKIQTLILNCLPYTQAKNTPSHGLKRIIKRNKLLALNNYCFQTYKAYSDC
jgi:hypothetical protein